MRRTEKKGGRFKGGGHSRAARQGQIGRLSVPTSCHSDVMVIGNFSHHKSRGVQGTIERVGAAVAACHSDHSSFPPLARARSILRSGISHTRAASTYSAPAIHGLVNASRIAAR